MSSISRLIRTEHVRSLGRCQSVHGRLPPRRRNIVTQSTAATTGTITEETTPKATVVQKVGRATATGSYFVVVSAGVALLGVVLWALGSNLFFETRYLNEAVTLIKNDPEVRRLIGDDIQAYGERSTHRGRRGGGVVSQRTEDGHVFMLFHVSGSSGRQGTCRLDVQERTEGSEVRQLYCDLPGSPRIWIKRQVQAPQQKKRRKLFSW